MNYFVQKNDNVDKIDNVAVKNTLLSFQTAKIFQTESPYVLNVNLSFTDSDSYFTIKITDIKIITCTVIMIHFLFFCHFSLFII